MYYGQTRNAGGPRTRLRVAVEGTYRMGSHANGHEIMSERPLPKGKDKSNIMRVVDGGDCGSLEEQENKRRCSRDSASVCN